MDIEKFYIKIGVICDPIGLKKIILLYFFRMAPRTKRFCMDKQTEEIIQILNADMSDDEDELPEVDAIDVRTLESENLNADHEVIIEETLETDKKGESDNEIEPDTDLCGPKFQWKKNIHSPASFDTSKAMEYSKVLFKVGEELTPLRVFEEVTKIDELLPLIKNQSELYAQQKGVSFTVTEVELKAFFGINYMMSYHIVPKIRDYWSTEPDLGVPYIMNVMTRARFFEIRSNLHFGNKEKIDRGYKVRPLIDHFNKAYQEAYSPSAQQSIDEHMIKFTGQNRLKQYVKGKPIKFGFKCWCRCAAKTGYLYQLDLYLGKKAKNAEGNLGESVITQFTEGFDKTGCEFYFDNLFNSPSLQYKLLQKNIKACGTVRANRKCMPTFEPVKRKNRKRGAIDHFSADGISVVRWFDNRDVFVCSNFIPPMQVTSVKRREAGSGSKIDVKCPMIIKKYNQYMGGVDLMDQNKETYGLDRKSKAKYYLRILFDFMDIAISNSFIVYEQLNKEQKTSSLSRLDFKRYVAKGLVGQFTNRKKEPNTGVKRGAVKRSYEEAMSTNKHQLTKTDKCARCAVCPRNKDRKAGNICTECNLYFCYTNERDCFAKYHKNINS